MITVLRHVTAAAAVGLTAAYGYYPHVTWIPIVLAAVSALGVYVIPSAAPAPPVRQPQAQPPK